MSKKPVISADSIANGDPVAVGANVVKSIASIPLFNSATLNDNFKALGPEILAILQQEAESFVKDNQDSLPEMSEDVVKSVLFQTAFEQLPIPQLDANASLEQRADLEGLLAARAEISALVAAAERVRAARIAELKRKAEVAGLRIATVLAGLGLKAVLGG